MARCSSDFEGFCIGLDIALTNDRSKPKSMEGDERRLKDAIREALSVFDLEHLKGLRAYISKIINSENPAAELETLWLSLKPNKAFFDRPEPNEQNTAYLFIFRKAVEILDQEIAGRGP